MAMSADLGKTLEKFVTDLWRPAAIIPKARCCVRASGSFRSARPGWRLLTPLSRAAWPMPTRVASNQRPRCLTAGIEAQGQSGSKVIVVVTRRGRI